MPGFIKKFIAEWRSLKLDKSKTVVAAVSGGADSCALLAALAEIRKSGKIENDIVAAHFDHGLRGEDSDRDHEFTAELAAWLKVGFISGVAGSEEIVGNIEQSARRARYRFLTEAAKASNSSIVVTGHTRNDQAETLLLNLIRGSGQDGIAAMRVERSLAEDSEIRLVRPLLRWANRSATEEFCKEMGIAYRRDLMNDDPAFARVSVRKRLIPILREINPKIVDALVRAAGTALETRFALDWFIQNDRAFFEIVSGKKLRVQALLSLPKEMRNLAVREWLKRSLGGLKRISSAHIGSVVSLAESRKSGKTVELPAGTRVVKGGGALELQKHKVEKTGTEVYN